MMIVSAIISIISILFISFLCIEMWILFAKKATQSSRKLGIFTTLSMLIILVIMIHVGYFTPRRHFNIIYQPKALSFIGVTCSSDKDFVFLIRDKDKVYLKVMTFLEAPAIIIDTKPNQMYVKWLESNENHNNKKDGEIHLSPKALNSNVDYFRIMR